MDSYVPKVQAPGTNSENQPENPTRLRSLSRPKETMAAKHQARATDDNRRSRCLCTNATECTECVIANLKKREADLKKRLEESERHAKNAQAAAQEHNPQFGINITEERYGETLPTQQHEFAQHLRENRTNGPIMTNYPRGRINSNNRSSSSRRSSSRRTTGHSNTNF